MDSFRSCFKGSPVVWSAVALGGVLLVVALGLAIDAGAKAKARDNSAEAAPAVTPAPSLIGSTVCMWIGCGALILAIIVAFLTRRGGGRVP